MRLLVSSSGFLSIPTSIPPKGKSENKTKRKETCHCFVSIQQINPYKLTLCSLIAQLNWAELTKSEERKGKCDETLILGAYLLS